MKNSRSSKSCNGWAMRGDDYTDQVGDRAKELSKYKRVMKVCIDATGVGDPVVDNFKRSTRLRTEPVKFTLQKGQPLKNLIKILQDGGWFIQVIISSPSSLKRKCSRWSRIYKESSCHATTLTEQEHTTTFLTRLLLLSIKPVRLPILKLTEETSDFNNF